MKLKIIFGSTPAIVEFEANELVACVKLPVDCECTAGVFQKSKGWFGCCIGIGVCCGKGCCCNCCCGCGAG